MGNLAKASGKKYHVKQPEMAAGISSEMVEMDRTSQMNGMDKVSPAVEKQLPSLTLKTQSNLIRFLVSTTQELNFPKRNC